MCNFLRLICIKLTINVFTNPLPLVHTCSCNKARNCNTCYNKTPENTIATCITAVINPSDNDAGSADDQN